MEKKKHLIFDFDETIATLKIDWSDWHPKMAQIFKKFDKTYIYNKKNVNWLTCVIFTKKYGKRIRDEIVTFHNQYEKEKLKGYVVNNKLVDYIKKNTYQKNYLITNNTRHTILPILEEIGIKNRFGKIVTLDDLLYCKPHPEGILKIIDKNIPLSDYAVIGDSKNDESVAKSVGVDFIKIVFKP